VTDVPAVGFDLDMTLIDSRPGIREAYLALTAETGVFVDADLAVSRLGPPLRTELSCFDRSVGRVVWRRGVGVSWWCGGGGSYLPLWMAFLRMTG
jgi:phosphoglycolate phosphatase-like HAD superfamily hydrolase